ncbi:hypothetical protein GCK72_023366 [Caenorhabditis remanei]|uniref:SID1 transmembrane family member 1 n=1 Tax=Caenorhabditis remanei TaxID=31234 RepID=A0A6A5FWA1_CAERE|nr:hypothetical protein GCK72_023366 [Caenorhabditis remanei]KAF1746908.1 hypothetical protein GCK72_023366 [Caenorhabditis remanei]
MKIFLILISVHFGVCHNFQDLSLGVVYSNLTTSGSLVTNLYRVVLDAENPPPAISLSVSCEKSVLRNSLTVTVIRGKTVHNIPLPRVQSHQGKKFEYWFASDTLCDDDTSMEQLGQPIYISISSSLPTVFNLKVQAIDNFHIRNSRLSIQTSPSEPSYFIYSFPDNIDKVDVRVTSNDQICARIIARRANCPIFDGSGSLELSDRHFYQSFKKFGGFSLRKSDIGVQFHLAVTVNPDNSVCDTSKNNSFLLAVPILVYALSVIIVLLLTFFKYKLVDCYENNEPSIFEGNESEANVIIDKTALFVKPENVVSHKEYEKQRIVKDSKYFNSLTMFVIPNQTVTSSCFRLGKGLVGIYLFYYTIQKVRFEWSSFSTLYKISCFLLTIFFICMECMNRYLATYRNTYAVLLTPAESRELNTECVLPGIDWKDLRHYNCALDCFLFIVLMDYIDSNLKGYGTVYKNTTLGKLNSDVFELAATNDSRIFSVRVIFTSLDHNICKPVSLVLMRGPSYLSTFLPRIQTFDGPSTQYFNLAETLCEQRNLRNATLTEFTDTVRLSVSSSVPATYTIKVVQVFGYVLGMLPVKNTVSPPEPVFYRFSFPDFINAISIRVTSDDNHCGRVTIQAANCPVFDTEGQVVLYDSYVHQTFTKKSFIIVNLEDFDRDIHVIVSVLPIDTPCLTRGRYTWLNDTSTNSRSKNVTIEVNAFNPNISPLLFTCLIFIFVLVSSGLLAFCCYRRGNDNNPDDHEDDGTWHLWNLSLSQLFVILPISSIVIAKHADSFFAKDTDICNFNFECSTPLGNLKAFNSMLSASSIIFASGINVFFSFYLKRQRRFFPLNSCIFLTGVLWTLMNYCPQKHSFHLFTMTMIMTTLEAKFLLFGIRAGRNLFQYRFIGSMTMILMFSIILDTTMESPEAHKISICLIVLTSIVYTIFFSYIQGLDFLARLFDSTRRKAKRYYRWIRLCCSRNAYLSQSIGDIHVIQSEDDVINLSQSVEPTAVAPSTSRNQENIVSFVTIFNLYEIVGTF